MRPRPNSQAWARIAVYQHCPIGQIGVSFNSVRLANILPKSVEARFDFGTNLMPSMFQIRKQLYIKRGILILSCLVVAVGIYFALKSPKFDELKKKFFAAAEDVVDANEENKIDEKQGTFSEFEAFLHSASDQQLILRAAELVDSPRGNIVKRLDRQNQKIKIAEKLMEQTANSRTSNIGITSKLKALQSRESIHFDNGLSTEESLQELVDFAESNSDNPDSDIKRNVSLALLQSAIFSDLMNSKNAGMQPQTLETFEATCTSLINDRFAGNMLFNFLKQIHVHAPREDHEKFVSVFKSIFENSEVANLQSLASQSAATMIESEFELDNIFDSIDSLRDEAVQKLTGQIKNALNQNFVSEGGFRRIYKSIQDIVSVRNYDSATELSNLLQQKIQNTDSLADLAEANNATIKRLKLVNGPLDLSVLTSLDGKPLDLQPDGLQLKAIIFISKTTFSQSDKVIFNMLKTTSRFIRSKKFSVTAILIDDGMAAKAIEEVKHVNSQVLAVDFVTLQTETPGGKVLFDRISIDKYPTIMLLNGRNEVIGVDVAIDDFERQFFDLMDKQ